MPAPAIPTGQAMEELILVAVLGLCIALALILRSLNESVRNMDQKLDALTAYVQARLGQIASQRREMSQSRVDEVPRTDTATAPGAAAPMAAATSHEEEARTPPATAMDASGPSAAMAEKRLLPPLDEILGEEEPRPAHETPFRADVAASEQTAASSPLVNGLDEHKETASTGEEEQAHLVASTAYPTETVSPMESAEQAAPAARVTADHMPSRTEGVLRTIFGFLKGGNIWVAGGVLLMLAGFSFLISFMSERSLLSVEMSISLAALGGLAMVGLGLFLRKRRRIYAMVMQGGGIGVIYLASFAAAKLTSVLSPTTALVLMTLLIVPAVALAMLQRAEILAIFGFLGGYAAPVLLSTGSGDYVLLFSYYMVLNIALLGISKFRLWRWLNLLGATCSFGIMGAWGVLSYQPAMFLSVEPFILGFTVLFLLITLVSVRKKEFSLANPPDMSLALGVPLASVLFQWRAAEGLAHGLSLSALGFGAFFILLALFLRKGRADETRRLSETYAASGALLANLAIPLEFSGTVTSGIWAAEGALTFFFGCRYGSGRVRTAGLGLQAAAMISYSLGLALHPGGQGNVLLEAGLIALSALASAFWQERANDVESGDTGVAARILKWIDGSIALPRLLCFTGLFWWFTGLGVECWRFADEPEAIFLLAGSASSALFFIAAKYLRLHALFAAIWPILAFSLIRPLFHLLPQIFDAAHIFYLKIFDSYAFLPGVELLSHQFLQGLGGLSWLAFAVAVGVYYLASGRGVPERVKSFLALVLALEAVLVATSSARALAFSLPFSGGWSDLAAILPGLAYIFLMVTLVRLERLPMPYLRPLFLSAPLFLFAALAIWVIFGFADPGMSGPMARYMPLLNPLELQQAACFGMFFLWGAQLRGLARKLPERAVRRILLATGLLMFIWLHSILVRTTHVYTGAAFGFAVWHENLFQALLTLLWGVCGTLAIAIGHKKRVRPLWLAGATLIVLDTVKLFFIDLADKDTLYHIVSFFIIGAIFLMVGLVAPLPPSVRNDPKTGPKPEQDERDAHNRDSGNEE